MPENGTNPTPPAGGNSELTALAKSVNDLQAKLDDLVKNQSILADTLAKLPPASAEQPKTEQPKSAKAEPLTLEQVQKTVNDALAAHDKSSKVSAEKSARISKDLADVPARYRSLGDDPAKWDDEVKAIKDEYRRDFRASEAATQTNLDGNGGGKPPASAASASKDPIDELNAAVAATSTKTAAA